jgi:tetratricopeptide (TPR) repeat protein
MGGGENSDAARIEADLAAAPLPRLRMDLLWIGASRLALLRKWFDRDPRATAQASLEPSMRAGANDLILTVIRGIRDGLIKVEDMDWAIEVDTIAGEAEAAYHRDDILAALERSRVALERAPGCDVYLLSIGSCYAALGALEKAIRYYERAAQISPQNEKIARNLAATREALKDY